MGYADRVPNRNVMSEHQWIPRVVPILGSTDRHLAAAVLANARYRGWAGSGLLRTTVGLAAHHHGPDDAGHPRPAPSQALVALSADLASPVFARCGILARRDADPRRKVPARAKGLRVRHPRLRGGRLLSAKLTPPIGPMPGIVARHWLV